MAVVDIGEYWETETDLGARDDSTARRTWVVVTDQVYTRESEIIAEGQSQGKFPQRFDAHPDNSIFTFRRFRVRRSESSYKWMVEGEYSSSPEGQKESDRVKEIEPNPTLRPAKVRCGTNRYTKAIYRDRNDKAIVNSAGDPFDPPAEADVSRWTIVVTKQVADKPSWMWDINQPINEDIWTIDGQAFEPETLKLVDLQFSERQQENGIDFYEATATLEYNRDTWVMSWLDQGLYQLSPADDARVRCVDSDSKPAVSPQMLNGAGLQLATQNPDTAVFLDFDICETLSFAQFQELLT